MTEQTEAKIQSKEEKTDSIWWKIGTPALVILLIQSPEMWRAYQAGNAFGKAWCTEARKGLSPQASLKALDAKLTPEERKKFDYPKRYKFIAKEGVNNGLKTCGRKIDLSFF